MLASPPIFSMPSRIVNPRIVPTGRSGLLSQHSQLEILER